MKWVPKQSACPHCQTVYRYGDLKRVLWKKHAVCDRCGKEFRVSRRSLWILAAELVLIYVILNSVMLGAVQGLSFWGLFIVNVFPALAAVWLLPGYIELIKVKK